MWSKINLEDWESVQFIKGKLATAEDVKLGRAVFYINADDESKSAANDMALPTLAIWHDSESAENVPGVIIQAEKVASNILIGFRPLGGGNLIGTIEEFSIINSLDELSLN